MLRHVSDHFIFKSLTELGSYFAYITYQETNGTFPIYNNFITNPPTFANK